MSLLKLQEKLVNTAAPAVFAETQQSVGQELKTWGDSAADYYQESAEEVKDLLLHVAKAAAEVGDRDQRYGEYFQALAGRLQVAAKLQNISAMRQSLSSNAVELVDSVTRMTEDGKRTVEELRAQVSAYQERMEKAERLAAIDPLTGVSNRRILEWQIERRMTNASPFFVVYLDLNEFKQINDALGHQAGDDLLMQFAGELRQSLRSTDLVGRLGGDEFVVAIDGVLGDVKDRVAHVKKGVNGDYSISTDTGKRKISITAAVGIAVWKTGDTVEVLLRAAELAMYEDKKGMSKARNPTPGAPKA